MSYKKVHLNINKTSVNSTNVECSICLENKNNNSSLITSCNHVFCISCFKKYMISIQEQNLKCPYCRQIIIHINLQNQEEINILRKTFCKTIQQHCQSIKRSIHLVKLDPAAEEFEFKPSSDIRDFVLLSQVMEELEFGPNGGLIYCL